MDIYFLFPSRHPLMFKPKYGGGSGIYLYQLTTGLADRGLSVHVIANLATKSHPKVKLHHVNFNGNILSRNLNYLIKLIKIVKDDFMVAKGACFLAKEILK